MKSSTKPIHKKPSTSQSENEDEIEELEGGEVSGFEQKFKAFQRGTDTELDLEEFSSETEQDLEPG